MKKFAFLITLTLVCLNTNAQKVVEIIQWQLTTANGSKVFGIAPNMSAAEASISQFTKEHKSKKYAIKSSDMRHTLIRTEKNQEDPFKNFNSMAQNTYKILTPEELIALKIIKKKGFNSGVTYYEKTKKVSRAFSFTKFFELTTYYRPFMINEKYRGIATIVKK